MISQYINASKGNKSKVKYCFDCDEYDNKIEDLTFLKTVKKYCDDRGYDFIWFCKDVEQVYIGKRVDNSKKKNESTKFKKNNLITKVDVHRLSGRDYRIKTSNIMTVLDSYQELKRKYFLLLFKSIGLMYINLLFVGILKKNCCDIWKEKINTLILDYTQS